MAKENEYPRMLYAEDGRMITVNSEEEENGLDGDWGREPSDIHRITTTAITPKVDPSGSEPLVEMLIARMKAEFPSLAEASTEPSQPDTVRRGPGRPPGSRNL